MSQRGNVMDKYDEYEKECKRIRKSNDKLLSEYEKWLIENKLSKKTTKKHISNVSFFINDFLLYDDVTKAVDGAEHVGHFLGYWFIRKAMWADKAAIKENATSIKKFYQFLSENGKVSKKRLATLNDTIKEEMPDWLATMGRYDNPDIDDPEEIWGL